MNHARKTLSNRVILAELRGLDTIDKVKRLKPRSTILGVTPTLSLSLSFSIGCTVTVSYLFPVILVSHKGPSKKELGQAPINIFESLINRIQFALFITSLSLSLSLHNKITNYYYWTNSPNKKVTVLF